MVIQKPFSTANSEKNAFWFFLEDGACFAYISPWGGGMLSRESSHRGNSYYIAPPGFSAVYALRDRIDGEVLDDTSGNDRNCILFGTDLIPVIVLVSDTDGLTMEAIYCQLFTGANWKVRLRLPLL